MCSIEAIAVLESFAEKNMMASRGAQTSHRVDLKGEWKLNGGFGYQNIILTRHN